MTKDDGELRAERYRSIGDSLARLATRSRDGGIRLELMALAERFGLMAEHAEKWDALERASTPPE